MSRASTNRPVHSIWDRLLSAGSPPPATEAADLERLKQEVRRDLQDLLNTRRSARPEDLRLPELDRSLLAYGMPELTAINPRSGRDRQGLSHAIAEVIGHFEPRLRQVEVEHRHDEQDPHNPRLHFRISARLVVETLSGQVEFDTELDLGSRSFAIR